MQTFMPYINPLESVQSLSTQHLNKQRIEAMGIYQRLVTPRKFTSYLNHPAVLMWKGYETALAHYFNCCLVEWVGRGFKNNMSPLSFSSWTAKTTPPWVSWDRVHWVHQRRLAAKNELYQRLFEVDPLDKEHNLWPVTKRGLNPDYRRYLVESHQYHKGF